MIIKAMVEAYRLDKPGFSDLVGGKGRGLAILLHGPPGTGKTLTAGQSHEYLHFAIQIAYNPANPQQNAWQRNRGVLFSPSVVETWVPSQSV